MLHLRLYVPARLMPAVTEILSSDDAISSLAVVPGASVQPPGDLVFADVAREAVNDVIDRLCAIDLHHEGAIHIEPVSAWVSQRGREADVRTPGSSADAVVWAEVVQRAYDESELNWTYMSFMTLATLLASIAIIIDSSILVIGAMVLGPEFVAIAAIGVALVRRRFTLLRHAGRTIAFGFLGAILLTTVVALCWRAFGWVSRPDVTGPRPGTDFIYHPDKWTLVVAVIAGAAGVLSLTSSKVGGLSGVFISVTTVPAAGNVALGLAFGVWHEIWGSTVQLVVNIFGMALAGWVTLVIQQVVWDRRSIRRARRARLRRRIAG